MSIKDGWATAKEWVESWRRRGEVVEVMGQPVFVVDSEGDGPDLDPTPLVLLHGYPSSSFDFHRVWHTLAERRRVIAFDYPGFDCSSRSRKYSYSLVDQARVAMAV